MDLEGGGGDEMETEANNGKGGELFRVFLS